MGVQADSETLKQIPLFRDCNTVPLQILAFAAEKQEFSAGEDVITAGKKARAAFLVLNGSARLFNGTQNIGEAGPGSLLGEVSMFSAHAYVITATAQDRVDTVRITQELIFRVAREYPDFGQKMLQNLSERLDANLRDLESVRIMMNKSRSFGDL